MTTELFDYRGVQDFESGTILIINNDFVEICEMFQDVDGDIGFIFKGKQYYFRYCEFKEII